MPRLAGERTPSAQDGSDAPRSIRGRPLSARSIRAYATDCEQFLDWCAARGRQPWPTRPEVWIEYLTDQASTLTFATLRRRQIAIARANVAAGGCLDTGHPDVLACWAELHHVCGGTASKAPVLPLDLRSMLRTLQDDAAGIRDRAVLLLGFASALRLSGLVGLDVGPGQQPDSTGWVEVCDQSLILHHAAGSAAPALLEEVEILPSANVQECPVKAVQSWIAFAGICSGPLLRPLTRTGRARSLRLTGTSVVRIIKRAVRAAGYDPAQYASHSLRAGAAITQALDDVGVLSMQQTLGHVSLVSTMRYLLIAESMRLTVAAPDPSEGAGANKAIGQQFFHRAGGQP